MHGQVPTQAALRGRVCAHPLWVKLVDVAATALALASEIPSCFVLRTRCMLYSAECFRDTTKL